MDEFEDGAQLVTSFKGDSVADLGVHHGTVSGLQRRQLGIEVLVSARSHFVLQDAHICALVRLGLYNGLNTV